MKCDICKKEEKKEDLIPEEFEAGNNAEVAVTIWLCDACSEECEKDPSAFQSKYADIIEGVANETLYENAAAYADRPTE